MSSPIRNYIEGRVVGQSRVLGNNNKKRRIKRTGREITKPRENRNEGIKFEE